MYTSLNWSDLDWDTLPELARASDIVKAMPGVTEANYRKRYKTLMDHVRGGKKCDPLKKSFPYPTHNGCGVYLWSKTIIQEWLAGDVIYDLELDCWVYRDDRDPLPTHPKFSKQIAA